jgi:N4-gp56 family major capsid protein
MVWDVDENGGFMYRDELSDVLRTALQPKVSFRQLCEPDPDALNKGLHRGENYSWNVYGDVATQGRQLDELSPMPETNFSITQQTLTVVELGNSVPYTGKLQALAKHDVLRIIHKGLKNDARKAFDIEAWTQFDACDLRVAPTGGTSTTSVTLTTGATTATTNNVAMGTGHVKATVDLMRERDIPGYVDDDYVCIGHPTTFRGFKNELETIHQYTDLGMAKIFNGESGRYEGTRFVEQNFIPKGGAIDSTTHDPYTKTADAWDNGASSWSFFMGGDTVNEAIVIPEEIRAKLPGDFGRSGGIAWYYLGGFGIFHHTSAQSRIVKWDSAA